MNILLTPFWTHRYSTTALLRSSWHSYRRLNFVKNENLSTHWLRLWTQWVQVVICRWKIVHWIFRPHFRNSESWSKFCNVGHHHEAEERGRGEREREGGRHKLSNNEPSALRAIVNNNTNFITISSVVRCWKNIPVVVQLLLNLLQ